VIVRTVQEFLVKLNISKDSDGDRLAPPGIVQYALGIRGPA
jgi:hypothetical protein